MAKAKTTWGTNLNVTYVILGISLMVNAILISFFTYLTTYRADQKLLLYTLNQVCIRDYDRIMNSNVSVDGTNTNAYFSEVICGRDAKNGTDLTYKQVDGHMVRETK